MTLAVTADELDEIRDWLVAGGRVIDQLAELARRLPSTYLDPDGRQRILALQARFATDDPVGRVDGWARQVAAAEKEDYEQGNR